MKNQREEEWIKKLFVDTEEGFDDAFAKQVIHELPDTHQTTVRQLGVLAGVLLLGGLFSAHENIAYEMYNGAAWSVEACTNSILQFKSVVAYWQTNLTL